MAIKYLAVSFSDASNTVCHTQRTYGYKRKT
jgi:hypothetical protein